MSNLDGAGTTGCSRLPQGAGPGARKGRGEKNEHAQSTGLIQVRLYFVSGSQQTGVGEKTEKLTKCRRRKRENRISAWRKKVGRGFGARTSF